MSFFKKKTLLKWFSLVSTALIAVVLLILTWIYTTESGLQWLVARGAQFQPQELLIGKVSGTLSSSIHLTEFDWQQADTRVQAKNITVDCQWLYLIDRLVSCDTISLSSLDMSSVSEKKASGLQDALPELNTVKLPVEVKIKQVTIVDINYKAITPEIITATETTPEESSQYNITGLTLKKLTHAGSKASVSALNFSIDEHNIAVSGYLDMRKKWQHQLAVTVQGAKLSASVKSKGRISDASQLTLQLQAPNQISVTTDWFYNRGLFLKRGKLIAEKQQVELANEKISIEHVKANFELNWPKITSQLQAKAIWQDFAPITLDGNAELASVLNWRSSAAVSMLLKSELSDNQIASSLKQVFPDAIANNTVAIEQSWPVLANLEMELKQGLLSVKSNAIKFGELTAVVQGEFNIDKPTTENLLITGQLYGRSLAINNAFEVANVDVSWLIEKQQSHWVISSQGEIGQLALAKFDGKNIHWAVDFSDHWQADIKADLLNINDTAVELPSLKFTGLPEKHNMLISANLAENTSVNLIFDGKLLQAHNKPFTIDSDLATAMWQISNLEFKALNQQEKFLLAAEQLQLNSDEQRIKNLCLSGSGTFCLNAKHQANQWSANLTFDQWYMSPVFEQFKAWQSMLLSNASPYSQQVQGKVTGNLDVIGHGAQLETIAANISIPDFKWLSSDIQIQGQELTINTQQQKNTVAITTQWQTINADVKLPEWQAEIVMPKGQVLLSITPDFKLDFDLEQTDITLSIPSEKSKADIGLSKRLLTIALVKLQGKWQQDKVSSRLNIRLPGDDEITAQLSTDWPLVDSANISGDLSLNLKEFDWFKHWQKGIDKIDISLVQNFTLAGTLKKPILEGEGSLAIDHLVIDEYGLDIRNSKIKLSSQQDSIILLGELQNPQGSLTIAGDAKLSAPIKANLTIEGQQVTLVNNNDNKLIVSPMLKANFQNNHLTVDGNLIVDQADIKIGSLPKPAISVSEDQVIVDEKDLTVKDSPFEYDISLTLSAGNNVKISGFGLSSEIQGNLASTLITGQALTLNGRLDLKDGKFEAYKQTLTIEQGQLLFLGTAANPSIQFRAVRIVDDIKVGIIADGTIHNPRLTLFSEPAMADENILSLLITGRNLDSLSQQEGNALTTAAISLGVESANKLVQKIGDQLGLKDVAFTSKSGNNGNSTRVDIAAKINDRLNVGYGTSIDSDSSVQAGWNIEYKLSPSISFEAISGDEISANINYKKQFSTTKDKDKDKDNNNKKDQN
ncbi:translocation/assembly module TamB domain-containing protein [Colwellia sp. BRX10-3]|uniref:translocation/assembly module TamB domain-containing protein n=1 Tax=Colwellia sp. BRX10-3 TaxID=2759844 RepID=UPI0015F4F074|nr:translocation/assembly module TamB domain-containing protein [Colwellia sp. BRX10-3]MBA6391328.1 translocation/assembly module TamB domain-containing protein [Colwellia sp. BRX10-3]